MAVTLRHNQAQNQTQHSTEWASAHSASVLDVVQEMNK